MKVTKTYHVVHDQDGNIKSVFATTSSVDARDMLTPAQGYLVSQVDFKVFEAAGEDPSKLRELMNRHRVDTSIVGSLINKKTTSQE
jgi:hypothetical protein